MSQSELARRVGIRQSSVAALLSGKSQGSKHLHRIARVLETTSEKLTGEDAEPAAAPSKRLAFQESDGFTEADFVEIEQVDVRFGMGGTYLDSHVERTLRPFPREWVRMLTDAPMGNLVWTSGVGDSMEPTIRHGDPLLADLGQNRLVERDAIWLCALGEIGMIKRLRPHTDGSVEILSDNPLVPSMLATDGELHIIGRVLGRWGRL